MICQKSNPAPQPYPSHPRKRTNFVKLQCYAGPVFVQDNDFCANSYNVLYNEPPTSTPIFLARATVTHIRKMWLSQNPFKTGLMGCFTDIFQCETAIRCFFDNTYFTYVQACKVYTYLLREQCSYTLKSDFHKIHLKQVYKIVRPIYINIKSAQCVFVTTNNSHI